MCDHLHDTTSRYDAAEKVMTFLLVCRTCGIERVVETLDYDPRPVCTSPAAAPCQLAVLRWKRRFRRTRRRPVAVSQARRLISSSDRK